MVNLGDLGQVRQLGASGLPYPVGTTPGTLTLAHSGTNGVKHNRSNHVFEYTPLKKKKYFTPVSHRKKKIKSLMN